MGYSAHRVYTVLFLILLLQACGNKGELTLDAPAVSNEDLELLRADETESENDKKKDQRRD
ncbi:MAG: hypothetical protein AB8B63_15735 [Granulosicoccus sp.]